MALAKYSRMPAKNQVTRRNVLVGAPMAVVGAALAASAPQLAKAEIIEAPFLHVLSADVPGCGQKMRAGDVVLIAPGVANWDDLHLLRDGRFAAVQVLRAEGEAISAFVYETGERIAIPRERAEDYISGRVVKCLRLSNGKWTG